jgi:hypothetical protein
MGEWWSIEVCHGDFSARRWQGTYSSALIEPALSHGAMPPGLPEPARAGGL